MQQPPLRFLLLVGLLQRRWCYFSVLPYIYFSFLSVWWVKKCHMPVFIFLGLHPHAHPIHTHRASSWLRNAKHLSAAQHSHWYTNAYIQCGCTERYSCHMETTSDTYGLGQMGEKSVPLTLAMQRTFFAENRYFVLTLHVSEAPKHRHQLVSRKSWGEKWGSAMAWRGNRSPWASFPHPHLQRGWTQPKEAAVLRPPTDWQLHVGIPIAARKELAAILPPRAPSLRGTIYTSPPKNWIPRCFIQPNDSW